MTTDKCGCGTHRNTDQRFHRKLHHRCMHHDYLSCDECEQAWRPYYRWGVMDMLLDTAAYLREVAR